MKNIFPFWVLVIFSLCILECLFFLMTLPQIFFHGNMQYFMNFLCVVVNFAWRLFSHIKWVHAICFLSKTILFINFFFKYPLFVEILTVFNTISHVFWNNVMSFSQLSSHIEWTSLINSIILLEGFNKRLWIFMYTFLTQGWDFSQVSLYSFFKLSLLFF
jgi:hypothetical protein